jgi:two-component system, chemotaxis family, chemotaxis protein CheY
MINILIVDDTKAIHLFVTTLLSKSKQTKTTSVYDGKQAIDALKKDANYDLILLDWEMPNLNGPGTLSSLKDMGLKIPVVMMTTKNEMADISEALTLGAAEYMMKPFTIDILFEKIGSVLHREIPYAA